MLIEPQFEESAAIAAMGNPHVVYLRYRLLPTNDAVEFRAPPLDLEMGAFAVHVGPEGEGVTGPFAAVSTRKMDDGSESGLRIRSDVEAVFTFKKHYSSEAAAHEAVRPFLEAWELDAALNDPGQPPRFRLEFAGSLIVDRAPPPGEEAQYAVSGAGSIYVRPPEQTVVVEAFRAPPEHFAADEHAVALWRRWEPYLKSEDSLGAAAYACLSYIERVFARGEKQAAERLGFSRAILRTVRQLTSRVGDEATARKFDPGPRRPYTDAEVALLEAVVTRFVRRAGELAAVDDPTSLPRVAMGDFPPL